LRKRRSALALRRRLGRDMTSLRKKEREYTVLHYISRLGLMGCRSELAREDRPR
jgi:hypothetical protein